MILKQYKNRKNKSFRKSHKSKQLIRLNNKKRINVPLKIIGFLPKSTINKIKMTMKKIPNMNKHLLVKTTS